MPTWAQFRDATRKEEETQTHQEVQLRLGHAARDISFFLGKAYQEMETIRAGLGSESNGNRKGLTVIMKRCQEVKGEYERQRHSPAMNGKQPGGHRKQKDPAYKQQGHTSLRQRIQTRSFSIQSSSEERASKRKRFA